MAKQSFSVGQVLTAAQMTSLQQTAMLGGAASAKTANYTLVAADAGTAISMTSTSATTITVNTGLFASGDTVLITNLGSGVCTITAGTATVNTSASLALAQYESGTLYFTSSSAAIFIKGAGAPAASGGMTLISTTTLTGSSVTLSSIPSGYNSLELRILNFLPATDAAECRMRINGDSNTRYSWGIGTNATDETFVAFNYIQISAANDNSVASGLNIITIPDYTSTNRFKTGEAVGVNVNQTTTANFNTNFTRFYYNQLAAITSLDIFPSSGNFTSGTALLYGVK